MGPKTEAGAGGGLFMGFLLMGLAAGVLNVLRSAEEFANLND